MSLSAGFRAILGFGDASARKTKRGLIRSNIACFSHVMASFLFFRYKMIDFYVIPDRLDLLLHPEDDIIGGG